MQFITGTWAGALASNVFSMDKTAADETSTVYIPFPSRFSDMAVQSGSAVVDRGVRVLGIEIMYSVATAAMDAVAATLYKDTYAANGTLNTAAAVTTTYDTGHDTAAERITVDEHRLALLIAAGDREFLTNLQGMHAEVSLNAAATSVVKVFGAIWHFELIEE